MTTTISVSVEDSVATALAPLELLLELDRPDADNLLRMALSRLGEEIQTASDQAERLDTERLRAIGRYISQIAAAVDLLQDGWCLK